ncbi:MAG: hypothetical protein ALAOOOJD_02294 [bacterium]|nr:hypothetical protein [bacterium]
MLAKKQSLLGGGHELEIGIEAEIGRKLTHQLVAERMKGRNRHVGVTVRHQHVDTLFHFRGSFVGERERENLFGLGELGGDQIGNAIGNDARFAGAGAGDDRQRPGGMFHRFPLLVIQLGKNAVDGEIRRRDRFIGDCRFLCGWLAIKLNGQAELWGGKSFHSGRGVDGSDLTGFPSI